jgi:hypothetical protein
MKPFFRIFFGSVLALLAGAAVHAAPVIVPSGVTATAASAAPGDTITVSVLATNAGAATTADDLGAGGTVTGTVVFTHRVTGATISTGSVTFSTTAIVAGAGGSGTFTRTFSIPTVTSQAGAYDGRVTLTGGLERHRLRLLYLDQRAHRHGQTRPRHHRAHLPGGHRLSRRRRHSDDAQLHEPHEQQRS